MNKASKEFALRVIKDYPKNAFFFELRRNELLHPHNEERDENIGGGRMQGGKKDGNENRIINIADDDVLKGIEREKRVVEFAFKQSDSITIKIVRQYLMDKYPKARYLLCDELSISNGTFYNRLNAFIELVRELLGGLYEKVK